MSVAPIDTSRLFCVIPMYRGTATIVDVVERALPYVERVVVVDDACPERSGDLVREYFRGNDAVCVLQRDHNGGVGAAMKTGIAYALEHGADVIVKIDADGQMDPRFIPVIRSIFSEDRALVCIKGNRFFDPSVLHRMPKGRLFGNAALSLLIKCASGYWNILDPTNGYLAFNAGLLRVLPWQSFADSYFFEASVLCELGLKRLPILEIEMPTIYTGAQSSLSIRQVIREFPGRLFRQIIRRVTVQYFIFDVNLGSVYLLTGFFLLLFSIIYGGYEWVVSFVTQVPRATGTVMLAVMPFLMGFQLILNALMFDVQFAQRTHQELLVNIRSRKLPPPDGDAYV